MPCTGQMDLGVAVALPKGLFGEALSCVAQPKATSDEWAKILLLGHQYQIPRFAELEARLTALGTLLHLPVVKNRQHLVTKEHLSGYSNVFNSKSLHSDNKSPTYRTNEKVFHRLPLCLFKDIPALFEASRLSSQ